MCNSRVLGADKPEGACDKAGIVERLQETIRQKDLELTNKDFQLSKKDGQIEDLRAKCRKLTNEVMLAKVTKEIYRLQMCANKAGQPTSEAPQKPAPKPGFFNPTAPPTATMAASMRESVLAALGVMNDPNIGNSPGSLFGCKKAAANVNTAKGPIPATGMASMFSTAPSTAADKTGPTMFQPSFMRPASGMESPNMVKVPAPQAAPPPSVPEIPAVPPMPYRSRSGGVYSSSRPVVDVQTRFDFRTLCVNLPGGKAPVVPGGGSADGTGDNRAADMPTIKKTSAPAPARQSSVTNKITPPAAAAAPTQPAVTKATSPAATAAARQPTMTNKAKAPAATAPALCQPTVTKASAVKSSSSNSSRIPKPAVNSCTKVKSSAAPTTRAEPTNVKSSVAPTTRAALTNVKSSVAPTTRAALTNVKSSVAPTTRAEPTNVKSSVAPTTRAALTSVTSAAVSKVPAVTMGVVRSQSAADRHIQRLAASRRIRA
eukprot:jgi/Chrzof1/10883/Cz05g15260.t1